MSYLVFIMVASMCMFFASLLYSSIHAEQFVSSALAKADISLRYIFNVIV